MTEVVSTENHTPGPWSLNEGSCNGTEHGHWGTISGGADDLNIVTVWADIPELASVASANARLIAAAPEMLELLKKYAYDGHLQSFEARESFRKDALVLIAKAEGAGHD